MVIERNGNYPQTVANTSYYVGLSRSNLAETQNFVVFKPNSITLASSELAPDMFGASSELLWS